MHRENGGRHQLPLQKASECAPQKLATSLFNLVSGTKNRRTGRTKLQLVIVWRFWRGPREIGDNGEKRGMQQSGGRECYMQCSAIRRNLKDTVLAVFSRGSEGLSSLLLVSTLAVLPFSEPHLKFHFRRTGLSYSALVHSEIL